jgi:hypothetical protein
LLRRNIFRTVAESKNPELIDLLCDFARRASPGDCELIIRLLSSNDSPCVEEMLIALVASADLIVAGAAIETLGLVGTARAIAPLADRFSDPFLGEPARASLKQIRARTGAGKAGEAGRISLAPSEAQAGAVSVVAVEGELELLPPDLKSPRPAQRGEVAEREGASEASGGGGRACWTRSARRASEAGEGLPSLHVKDQDPPVGATGKE